MGTKVNSNYDDLLTFTRASKGHALRPVSYGDQEVTNGTYDTDSDWTLQRVSIAGGVADFSDNSLGPARVIQDDVYTVGKIYLVTFDVNESGTLRVYDGASYDGDISVSSGTVSKIIYAEGTQFIIRANVTNDYTGTIDNVSVKEVLFDQPDGTLTLFEHPNNVPRVEYDAAGNRLGLLVEEQRVNLIVYSDFSSGWVEFNVAPIAFNVTGPDGVANSAITLQDNGAGGSTSNARIQDNSIAISASTAYTASVFVKAGNNSEIEIKTANDDATRGGLFNISTETFTPLASETGTIQNVGNGWYRCAVTWTSGTDTSIALRVGFPTITLDGTNTIYLYGAQLEAGSFPTSYIKNEGTPSGATRSADVASIPVADFGYNQSAGTVVVEATTSHPANLTNQQMWQANDGTSVNRIEIYQSGSGNPWPRVTAVFRDNNSTTQSFLCQTNGWESNNRDIEKVGLAYKSGSSILDTTTDDSPALGTADIPTGMTQVLFAHRGHIKSIKYYPRRLTNAQLQDLTS